MTTTEAPAGPLQIEVHRSEQDELFNYGPNADAGEQADVVVLNVPACRRVQNGVVLLMIAVQLAWLGALAYGVFLL